MFASRRFLPLFITQFLGALNDNLLKNSLVVLITYRLAAEAGQNAQVMVTLAAGLFILPFFLFSALAGQLADKYDRSRITHIVKLVEIVLMLLAALGFALGNSWFLLAVLFGMGLHSTFFGPIKFALLPQHLQPTELLRGNAYIEAGTFLAILIGTIAGGLLVMQESGTLMVSGAMIAVAGMGYVASRAIPTAAAPAPLLALEYNLVTSTKQMIQHSRKNQRVFRSILGISWFWLVGATFLSQFPSFAKEVLHSDETVVTLFLTLFSVGIGMGSILSNVMLKGKIESKFVPYAALIMALAGIDLYFSSQLNIVKTGELLSVTAFLAVEGSGRILLDLLMIAIAGGVYIVPLYALMQHEGDPAHMARIIAANNMMNALFMVLAALVTLALLAQGTPVSQVFLIISLLNLAVAIYIKHTLPPSNHTHLHP